MKRRYVNTGFLIDFISGPVNSGFTSAVAILIIASQIKDLIGIKAAGTTLLDMAISIYRDVHNAKLGDTIFGIVCIVVIISLRVSEFIRRRLSVFTNRFRIWFKRVALCQIGPADVNAQTKMQRIVNRSMWLIGTFRNSIVVIVSGYVSYFYIHSKGLDVTNVTNVPELPFKVIGT